MPLLTTKRMGNAVEQLLPIYTLSDDEKKIAIEKFNDLKQNGVLHSDFSDDIWRIDNETMTYNIRFNISREAVACQDEMNYDDFVNAVKYYIALCFGKTTATMFSRLTLNIGHAVDETNCFTNFPKNSDCLRKAGVADFISLLPWVNDKFVFPLQESKYEATRKRSLAEYQSFFLFDDIMNDFWSNAIDLEKDAFYPIYLWWNISMIIPVRVTEFTVTPRMCLSKKGDKWYLTIRRTSLKGNKTLERHYNIEGDYNKFTYEITEKIALDIQDFITRSKKYQPAEIDSMFSDDMYGKSLAAVAGIKVPCTYPHMRASHFDIALDCFYSYVVKKYGYSVLSVEESQEAADDGEVRPLPPKTIVKLSLGDTRHIALQNLLINGCNILMAKEISGHETIDMIFHYSGNMKNLVKCRAYDLLQKSKNKGQGFKCNDDLQNYFEQSFFNSYEERLEAKGGTAVDGGVCCSPAFCKGADVSDCKNVSGNCNVCTYFIASEKKAIEKDINIREKEFIDSMARLKIWMNSGKKLKSSDEIMTSAEQMATSTVNLEMEYIKSLEAQNEKKQ